MAKPLGEAYRAGQRAMQKYKLWKTVDCVVGGCYPRHGGRQVEYLLLAFTMRGAPELRRSSTR
jgi:ATP-dependent DNA ligase